ncbi:MAG: hypothetical protein QOF78_1733 [Phycisphaerales bacterium]|jgi:predicted CoA-binding protein|nr:hypothetical protein [Phycisphaerales bacterium]
MKKRTSITTRTAAELAAALGLSPRDGSEIEVRSALNDPSIRIVRRQRLTTRATAILQKALALPVAKRLWLVNEIWNSIAADRKDAQRRNTVSRRAMPKLKSTRRRS